ncbi:putative butyrophilin-like protein 10 [Equus asinus]|uniref:putative butyrophilin-like protein 10 n=1 Tax=Equus asinus TaxID=9793 RepID=UPI0038F70F1F
MAKTHGQDAFRPIGSVPLLLLQLLSGAIPGNGRKADFEVLGPSEPVWAMVGGNVDLPCYLSPNISAEDMELRWYRDQPSPAVHVRRKGKDVPEEQMALYQGRTTFLKDGVAQGRASVRIHNVTTFDNGMFHCQFNDSTVSAEATLWLTVAGLGSEPRIQVQVDQDGVVRAQCTSAGWYPEPQVEWTDFQGQMLPSETNVSVLPTTGLWAVTSSLTVPNKAVGGLACSVSSPTFPEKKVSRHHLSDPTSRWFRSTAWKIALPLILVAAVLGVATIISLLWKPQRVITPLYPDTASSKLFLFMDGKSVIQLTFSRKLPNDLGRFVSDTCVLDWEPFPSGRHSWEVEVGLRKVWILGMCVESLDQKARVPKSPQHGIWAVELYKKEHRARTCPRVRLHPPQPLHRVRFLLHCDADTITFYSVGDRRLICTFSVPSCFVSLQPFFCLWTRDPSPLTMY